MEHQEDRDLLESQVQQDLPVPLENQGPWDKQDPQDQQVRVEQMVVQVYLGRQDLTGLMERPVTAVRQDRSDQLVNQEHQAALDQQDPVETQAHQDQWERAALQVR